MRFVSMYRRLVERVNEFARTSSFCDRITANIYSSVMFFFRFLLFHFYFLSHVLYFAFYHVQFLSLNVLLYSLSFMHFFLIVIISC